MLTGLPGFNFNSPQCSGRAIKNTVYVLEAFFRTKYFSQGRHLSQKYPGSNRSYPAIYAKNDGERTGYQNDRGESEKLFYPQRNQKPNGLPAQNVG